MSILKLCPLLSIPSTDLSGQVQPMGESDSEDDEQRLNIAEAFADDDVMEEFSTRRKSKCVSGTRAMLCAQSFIRERYASVSFYLL